MNDENMQTINRYNREAKINPDNSVLVEIKLTGEQFELVKSGKYVVSLCAADSVGNLNGGDPRLQLTNWNAKQATAQQQQQGTKQQTQRRQIQSRRAPPTYDSLNPSDYIDETRMATTNPQSIRKRNQYNHPFSPLSSESSGLGQSYDSPPSEMPVKQTVMIQQQSNVQQQQQTPMLTNNNDVDYDEQQFKLDSNIASSSTSRTTSVDNAMTGTTTTTGMELSIEPNAGDGIFDDLYNDLNLYELNDIYDMPLN